jgi:hypothetical protein
VGEGARAAEWVREGGDGEEVRFDGRLLEGWGRLG